MWIYLVTTDKVLSLNQIMANPITRAVMVRDGTTTQEVVGLAEIARRRRADRRSVDCDGRRQEFGPAANDE